MYGILCAFFTSTAAQVIILWFFAGWLVACICLYVSVCVCIVHICICMCMYHAYMYVLYVSVHWDFHWDFHSRRREHICVCIRMYHLYLECMVHVCACILSMCMYMYVLYVLYVSIIFKWLDHDSTKLNSSVPSDEDCRIEALPSTIHTKSSNNHNMICTIVKQYTWIEDSMKSLS